MTISSINPLYPADIADLYAAFQNANWTKPPGQFERYFQECETGKRHVWIVRQNGQIAGYGCLLNQSSFYKFQENNIPEIADLNILPDYRGQGLATALMDIAEKKAKEQNNVIGIGVGLHAGYGAAQILYVKRGYIPRGDGIYYGGQQVGEEEQVTVDHGLVLYLQKNLK